MSTTDWKKWLIKSAWTNEKLSQRQMKRKRIAAENFQEIINTILGKWINRKLSLTH